MVNADHTNTNAKHTLNVQSQPFGRFRSFEPGVLSAFILTAKFPSLTRKVSAQILRRNYHFLFTPSNQAMKAKQKA